MVNKLFFSFLTAILTLSVSGQEISLVNLTVSQKESKIIYIGIENKFKVNGFENLRKVEPSNAIYFMKEDTLLIKPSQIGTLTLTFQTKGGPQPVNFDIKVISDVMPALGNLTNQLVDKKDVIAQGRVNLHSFNKQEIYFENYEVSSFEAHLNNQVFSIKGDRFTDDLFTAIKQAKSGDKLILANVKVKNATIGRTGHLQSRFSFELK